MSSKIKIGDEASLSKVVTNEDTAQAVGSGSLPVFATPMMIALMEQTACLVIQDNLEEGETSVGTGINVSHDFPTGVGKKLIAKARVTALLGRKIEFEVSVSDGERTVGKGSHSRFLVDADKFLMKM